MKAALSIMLISVMAANAGAEGDEVRPHPSYLFDGGAVPLLWLPLLTGYAIDYSVPPRSSPLLFASHAGGATPSSWEVPGWSVSVAGVGVAALYVVASDEPSRWYHAKGLAEAIATSSLVVAVVKPIVGRHRPDWSLADTDPTKAESFPSGHTTTAFAIATYSALYLHDHVSGNHVLAYTGILTGALLVAGERVHHHRHFVSDVVTGSLLGATTSYLIYRYQDARASGERTHDATGPALDSRAISIAGTF
jgi:membrane-associated phospholipid phosphatase